MIDRAFLKSQAKLSMRQARPSIYLVTLVFMIINFVLVFLDLRIQLGMSFEEYVKVVMEGREVLPSVSPTGSLISMAISIMASVLAVGYTYYSLRVSRNQKAGFGELFDGFGVFFKVIGLNIMIGIFTFLWSLLFVIPGIVAAYRYSMAFFVLMDDPDTPVMECIRRSKELTSGYKGSLFVLDLSFIGWNLLTAIPFVSLFVTPYYQVTLANYYNALSGYVPETEGEVVNKEPWEL